MLQPLFKISQDRCNTLVITDITPPYSPKYPGGYGGVNIEADRIVWSILTLIFANGASFTIGTSYNQTKPDWLIEAQDLPTGSTTNEVPCHTCGQGGYSIQHSDNGRMQSFPSGCITAKLDVYSADLTVPTGTKLEGTKVTRFISKCEQDTKIIELIEKLTLPGQDGCFAGVNSEDERQKKLTQLMIVWTKLELLEDAEGCDCDCIAATIKQAHTLITSLST